MYQTRLIKSCHGSIKQLAALTLLACCFIQLPAGITQVGTSIAAEQPNPNQDEMIILMSSVLGGLAVGQTMRFTLFNPGELDSRLSPPSPMRAQVKLFDAQGRVIAEREEVAILPGEFRSFNFSRSDIPLPGEEGTGRVQLRGTIRVLVSRDIIEARGNQIPASIELVDNDTGVTLSPFAPILQADKRVV